MAVTRTIEINDLTPAELAVLFAAMDASQQAMFFSQVWHIARSWPGAGWCQQSCEIANCADAYAGTRDFVTTLAAHFVEEAA